MIASTRLTENHHRSDRPSPSTDRRQSTPPNGRTRIFRHHLAEPAAVTSPLLRQLCREWVELNHDPATVALVEAWARTCPVLGSAQLLGDVVDLIDRSPAAATDKIMTFLLEQLHAGDQVAGRALLQAMLPALSRLRFRAPRGTASSDEQLQRVLAEFWGVIARQRSLPARGVAARLQLDTLRKVTSHSRSTDAWEEHTYLGDDDHQDAAAPESADPGNTCALRLVVDRPQLAASFDPDAGLYELLLSATAKGVLTRDQAQFLADVHLSPIPNETLTQAADRLDIPYGALRVRVHRLRTRLIQAVVDEQRVDRHADVLGSPARAS